MTDPFLPDPSPKLRLAIVGDIHGAWDADDRRALEQLAVDLVLFVGDFGNEAIDVVEQIAALPLPKAVILGNHDGWYTATPWGRKKPAPYDRRQEDRVGRQLALLGTDHVGFSRKDLPAWDVAIVGGRPFSWGGSQWQTLRDFYRDRYKLHSLAEATTCLAENALAATASTLIFLAHNGPAGLGHEPEAICGRDWQPLGGDFGDSDLTAAIAQAQAQGRAVALVAFGHMHHHLRHRQDRQRQPIAIDDQGTVYLNAAVVPRHRAASDGRMLRNFSIVELRGGRVERAALWWVDRDGVLVEEEQWLDQTGSLSYELQTASVTAPTLS